MSQLMEADSLVFKEQRIVCFLIFDRVNNQSITLIEIGSPIVILFLFLFTLWCIGGVCGGGAWGVN